MIYWLFDSLKSGEEFDHELDAKTMAEAVEMATAEWDGLTDVERCWREDFFVGAIAEEDAGYCDVMGWDYFEFLKETVDVREIWRDAERKEVTA